MKTLIIFIIMSCLASFVHARESDVLKKRSPYSVAETVQRFEEAVKTKGLKVFPRFDHAAAASDFGTTMSPAVVVAFGNPRYGTPFMIQNPAAGIDFPPKAIVYQDQGGGVWIAYNSSSYLYGAIFKRHGLEYKAADVDFFRKVLEELTDYAIAPEK